MAVSTRLLSRKCSFRSLFSTLTGKPHQSMKEMRLSMLEMMTAQQKWLRTTNPQDILVNLPINQSELPCKSMSDSWIQAVVPLGSDNEDRLRYLTPFDSVRFGRLLEDLDTFAVACCYKHNEDSSSKVKEFKIPRAIWTVLVDRIDLKPAYSNVLVNKDILLEGHVSWVGKSSMESTITVSQEDMSGVKQKLLEAAFVMASRNPLTNTAALVNGLVARTAEEEAVLLKTKMHQAQRKLMSDESLLKQAPNEEERHLIHKIFLDTLDPHGSTFKVRVKPADTVWMEDALLKTVRVCFPEQKNLYNKIFGGFLMRQAYELAWANSCVYSKNRCRPLAVDDIIFRAPVSIGSFLYLSSQIGYTDGNRIQVRVHAEVKDPKTGESCTTNEFHFTMETISDSPVPVVLPKTYAESMVYLDSRRRFYEAVSVHRL